MATRKKTKIILGASDLAEILVANLKQAKMLDIEACVVDKNFKQKDRILGIPVLETSKIAQDFPPENYECYLAFGYRGMNSFRASRFRELKAYGYELPNFVHPSATVNAASFGEGNLVFQNVLIDYFSTIGNGNIFYPKTLVAHHNTIGNFNFFAVSSCVAGHVTIADNCFLGANSTIRDGVSLSDYVLVGAACYVNHPVNPYKVVKPIHHIEISDKISTDFF